MPEMLARAQLSAGDFDLIMPIRPYTAQWSYAQNTVSRDTIGGRVVQLLSVQISDLQVESVAGSRKELQRIADGVRRIMNYHLTTSLAATFTVPSRNWRFRVFVSAMPQIGWDVAATAYPYTVTLAVQDDLSGVQSAALLKDELSRLADGIGYNPHIHGEDAAGFTQLVDSLLAARVNTGGFSSAVSAAGGSSGISPDKGQLSTDELAKLSAWALQREIPTLSASDLIKNTILAVAVALCESGGNVGSNNPNATNGTAIGLWQAAAGQNGFSAQELSTAEGNARWMAIELKTDYTCGACSHGPYGIRTWEGAWYSYWGCFRGEGSGASSHMAEARAAVKRVL